MTRRLMWLGVGAVAGSGATVWARRRLERLSQMKAGQVAGGVATLVDRGARSTAGHIAKSVDSGRSAARRREFELRHDLEARDLTR